MQKSIQIAFALACFGATSALAQDSTSTSAKPTAAKAPVISDEAHVQALQQYWTAERLAGAKPMPIPSVDPATVSPNEAPAPGALHTGAGGRPTVRDASSATSPERFPLDQGDAVSEDATPAPDGFNYEMPFNNFRAGNRNTYPYTTVGKLFFTIPPGASEPAGEYVCSAAVAVKSYMVITARHCVFDYVTSKWYSNWVFYPGWSNGSDSTLHGAWYPDVVATWVSSGTAGLTTGWDIGMMTMHDSTGKGCGGDSGHVIGSYTGWLGYSYGGNFTQRQWNVFGFPQASPFEGNYLYQDNGATGQVNPLGSANVVEVGNPQTGGTSGGPWMIGFDPNDATDTNPNNNTNPGLVNLENGVNSFVWTRPSEPLAINGTIFQQSNFWNLFTFLNAQTCK